MTHGNTTYNDITHNTQVTEMYNEKKKDNPLVTKKDNPLVTTYH